MTAISGRQTAPSLDDATRDVAPRALGIVAVGLVALAVPVLIGLMVAAVVHGMEFSGARLPIPQLAAVALLDVTLLGVVGRAGYRAWTTVTPPEQHQRHVPRI